MAITTRHKNAAIGSRLEFDLNGKIVSEKSTPRQVGTTVLVQNIFHSLPVRHKEFHRNAKKEFAKLVHILNAYCLISTNVRISCTNQATKGSRSTVVSTNGNVSMRENIANVFGPKQVQSLLEFQQVEASDEICTDFGLKPDQKCSVLYRVEGFVSRCEHGQGRSSTDRQFIFINQRPCDHTKILKLINEVYHSYNKHQSPFIALSISVDKESVDVNVTPDKRQIFLERENLLLATLKASLIDMFERTTSIYRVNNPLLPSLSVTRSHSSPSQVTHSPQEQSQAVGTPCLSSSLSKLKRSFSSAFARPGHSDSPVAALASNKSDSSCRTPLSGSKSITSSDRGSIKQFFSKFSPNKPQQSPTPSQSSMQPVTGSMSSQVLPLQPTTDRVSNILRSPEVLEGSLCLEAATDQEDGMLQSLASSKTYQTKQCVDSSKPGAQSSGSKFCHGREATTSDTTVLSDTLPDTVYNCAADDDVLADQSTQLQEQQPPEQMAHTGKVLCTDDKDNHCVSVGEAATGDDPRMSHEVLYVQKLETDQDFLTDQDLGQEGDSQVMKREQVVPFCLSRLRKQYRSNGSALEFSRDPGSALEFSRDPGSALEFCRSFRAKICPTDNKSAETELQREISKDMFEKMEVLGQFNLGFIITKLGQDLFIVDQHASDEKYNFEMLQKGSVLQGQKLIIPQGLDLTASNETILIDNLEVFKKNGFDFTIDSQAPPTQRVKLVSAPVSKNWSFGKDDIEELLFMLADSPNVMCWPSRVRMMFASRACRKSVMIGTALNHFEMKKLVDHMGQIEQPWNCPHGRPTMRHLFNLEMLPSSISSL